MLRTAAILVCNEERNLGRVPKLLRGPEVRGEGEKGYIS